MTKMAFFLLVVLGCEMWVNTGALKLAKPVLMGPSAGLLSNVTVFTCWVGENPQNLSVFYQLLDGDGMKVSEVQSTLHGEKASISAVLSFSHDGSLICRASGHNNSDTEHSDSDSLDFRVIDPVDGAILISTASPGDLWEGESLTLQCNISKGNYVSYSWLLNDGPVQLNSIRFQNQLTIPHLSNHDSGTYVCIASNQYNGTLTFRSRSNEIDVQVKEDVSKPGISFDVFSNAEKNLTANVTCELATGSPPINFTFLRGSEIISETLKESLTASLMIPVVLNQDMDLVHCQASNGKSLMKSAELNLTVEPVGGGVTMRAENAKGPLFQVIGVWLHCTVERGTFPHFSWFHNTSRLQRKGPFYSVFGKHHSGLSLALGMRSDGDYYCEAGNKFDNATRLRSQMIRITKEGLNKIPDDVVALVFTCFSVLIIAVTMCCLYGVLRRRQAGMYRHKQYFQEMSNIVDNEEEYEYENKEDVYDNGEDHYDEEDDVGVVGEYREDTDMEQSSTQEDSDEGEEEDETNTKIPLPNNA